MAEVRLENVTKYYGRKRAVKNISLTCREAEFFSIVGPTGAGKSTILKMIAGIEKISEGSIYFGDVRVNEIPPQERNVSMAFETYNLYPHLKVYDNIAFPLRAPRWRLKLSKEEEREKVEEIARFLGIEELLDRLPQHLSGGQKQRVSLSRALVRKPEVYLLDEPIAHLDARLKFSTQTLLKEFAQEYRSTIIYVTHDYREALALSDNMIVLRNGAIVQEGPPEEIYNEPATEFVGVTIGEPPMNIIEGEILHKGENVFFQSASNDFTIPIREDLVKNALDVVDKEGKKSSVKVGIRCENIKLGEGKISETAFQLPLYAVTHESEGDIVSFELTDSTFIYVRTGKRLMEYTIGKNIWLDFDQDNMFFYPTEVKSAEKRGSK